MTRARCREARSGTVKNQVAAGSPPLLTREPPTPVPHRQETGPGGQRARLGKGLGQAGEGRAVQAGLGRGCPPTSQPLRSELRGRCCRAGPGRADG